MNLRAARASKAHVKPDDSVSGETSSGLARVMGVGAGRGGAVVIGSCGPRPRPSAGAGFAGGLERRRGGAADGSNC